jgi:hypothetical protein
MMLAIQFNVDGGLGTLAYQQAAGPEATLVVESIRTHNILHSGVRVLVFRAIPIGL